MVIIATVASILPAHHLPPPPAGLSDKHEHFIAYGAMALWFAGSFPRRRYWLIGLALFLLGVSIEEAQGLMGLGRQADLYDVIANTLGVIIGLLLGLAGLGGWAQRIEAWRLRRLQQQ